MASTDELRDAADIALDTDPILVLNALGAALSICDSLAGSMPAIAREMRSQVGLALGIQEGGSGNG